MLLIKGKNWSFQSKSRLIGYEYIRYTFRDECESKEWVYCSTDTIFYMLLDLWNRENRHSKYYSLNNVRSYSIEINAIWNDKEERYDIREWREIFSSVLKSDIRNFILDKGIECRYVRVKKIDIDGNVEYILNISNLLGVF